MGATLDSLIEITIILDSIERSRVGFGTPLFLAQTSQDSLVLQISSSNDIDELESAGDITSAQAEKLRYGIMQNPRVSTIKLGRKDDGQSYQDALAAVESEDDEWYGLAIDSRSDDDIKEVSQWSETRKKLFLAQSSDSDWLEQNPDQFAFDGIDDATRTAVYYHPDDSAALDIANLTNRLAFSPDAQSAPWDGHEVRGVGTYSISNTELANIIDKNANVMLPKGAHPRVIDPGTNLDGRPLYEIVTKDWFTSRLRDRIARLRVNTANRGEKIPLTESISMVRPIVESVFIEGVAAGHFVADQWEVDFQPLSDNDVAERRIRATGGAQNAVSGRRFDLQFNFQQTPVLED